MSIVSETEAGGATIACRLPILQASLFQLQTEIEELSQRGCALQDRRSLVHKSKRNQFATHGMLQSLLRPKLRAERSKLNTALKGIDKELEIMKSGVRDRQQQYRQTTLSIRHCKIALAPISRIPYDILELIFLYSLPSYYVKPSTRQSPLLLTMVCRKWRSIALSVPSLWSSLSTSNDWPRPAGIFAPAAAAPDPRHNTLIQLFKRNSSPTSPSQPCLWLERAGLVPLRMEIVISKPVVWFTRNDPYFKWVTETSERWTQLRLHTYPDYLSLLLSKPIPKLRVLEIVAAHNHDPTTPIRGSDVFDLNPDTLSFPWTSLTTLQALEIWLTPEQLTIILDGSPNLRSCNAKIHDKQDMSITSRSTPTARRWMVHTSLTKLYLRMNDYGANALQQLLDAVVLTCLETLRIVNPDECRSDWPHNAFVNFAKQSQCPLQRLDVIGFSMITGTDSRSRFSADLGCIDWADPGHIREVWQCFPTLKRLGFT